MRRTPPPFGLQPSGAPLAFEYSDSATYHLTVLIGRYNQENGELLNPASGVSTKVRGIALTFRGPAASAKNVRDLANRTDLSRLNALLR